MFSKALLILLLINHSSCLQDKFKRSLAETENVRRRLTKQKDDAKLFGIQGFCKDLLNVADILQRATESVPADQIDSNLHLKNLYQGLSMTEGELKSVSNIPHIPCGRID